MRRHLVSGMLAAVLVMSACGAPTAQRVEDADAAVGDRQLERITFDIPAEWVDAPAGVGIYEGTTFAPPGGEQGITAPQFQFNTRQGNDQLSIETLRREPLDGVDPLSDDLGEVQLMSYDEIITSDAWGVRIVLVEGTGQTFDWQALVDRRDQSVTTSLIFCNLRCMIDFDDVVDEIQTSWSPGGNS